MTKRYTAQEAYEYWMTGDRDRLPFRVVPLQANVENVAQKDEGGEPSWTFHLEVIGIDPDGTKQRAYFLEALQTLYVRVPEVALAMVDVRAIVAAWIEDGIRRYPQDDSPDAT